MIAPKREDTPVPDIIGAHAFYLEFNPASDSANSLDCAFILRDQDRFSRISQTEFASPLTTLRFIYEERSDPLRPWILTTPPGTALRHRIAPSVGWVFGAKFDCRIDEARLLSNPERLTSITRRHLGIMKNNLPLAAVEDEICSITRELCDILCLPAPGPSRTIAHCMDHTMSKRTARRRFQAATGLPPKRHYTLSRFHSALAEVAKRNQNLSDIAYGCSYSDQPHFTRDFRKLSGQTPRQFLDRWEAHSVRFVQDREPGSMIRLAITVD